MTNMLKTIIPKSNQLNADDFIGIQTLTIKAIKVSVVTGDQPVAINYEGDNGKPFMPCKLMRRALVNCWGPDGNQYVGRLMTLYRDEKVTFGGVNVGGIRISHMSHITEPITMALTASKASRKLFTVRPLLENPVPSLQDTIEDIEKSPTLDGLKFKHEAAIKIFKSDGDRKKIIEAKEKRKSELTIKEGTPP